MVLGVVYLGDFEKICAGIVGFDISVPPLAAAFDAYAAKPAAPVP